MNKQGDEIFAETMFASAISKDDGRVPEYVGVSDVNEALKGLDPEALKKANESFVDEVISDIEALDEADKAYAEAEKALAKVGQTLRELVEYNRQHNVLIDTPQTEDLKKRIARLKAIMERAQDEEKFSAYARDLHDFRRTLSEIKGLIELGEKIAKSLKRGREVREEDLAKVMKGYADYFHKLVRESKVDRIPREQLKVWDRDNKQFYNFGFSWTYKKRQPDGSLELFCPDGDDCNEHWFWGKVGDDQGIRLTRAMIDLAGVKYKISELQRKKSRR